MELKVLSATLFVFLSAGFLVAAESDGRKIAEDTPLHAYSLA